jgi:hypothetical protein
MRRRRSPVAREAGVGRFVTIGTTLDSCGAMLELG